MPELTMELCGEEYMVKFGYTPEEPPIWHRGRLATPHYPAEAEVLSITDKDGYDVTEDFADHIESIEQMIIREGKR